MADSTTIWVQGKDGKWYDNNDMNRNPQLGGGYSGVKSTVNNPIPGAPNSMAKLTAQQLVDKVLLEFKNDTNYNLESFWNSNTNAVRTEAYNKIKDIVSSPSKMATYVKDKGIQNLEGYQWWSNSPYKQEAWKIVSPPAPTPSEPTNKWDDGAKVYGDLVGNTAGLQKALADEEAHLLKAPGDQSSPYRIDWLKKQIAGGTSSTATGTTGPDWTVQGKLNDLAVQHPDWTAEQLVTEIKNQVGYKPSDDEVYNKFYGYYVPHPETKTPGPGENPTGGTAGSPQSQAVYDKNSSEFDVLKQNEAFNALPPDMQEAVKYSYFLMGQGQVDEQKRFVDAMTVAAGSSNSLFAQQFRQLADQMTNYVSDTTKDYAFKADQIQKNIAEIDSRIKDASIDEQASLSRQKLQYENDLSNTRDQMAGRGITSSSIAQKAEANLAQNNQDVIETTKRAAQRSIRASELSKSEQQAQAAYNAELKQRGLRDKFGALESIYGTDIAKQYSGTFQDMPTIGEKSGSYIDPATGRMTTGILPIVGTYPESKAMDLITRTSAIMKGSTPITYPGA